MPEPQKTPTKPKARFQKTKRFGLAFIVCFALACLSFPIWTAWIAKPLASMAGVEIGSVQRLSWDRWGIEQLSTSQAGATFSAERAELPSPTKLLFEHFSSDPATESVALDNWSLDLDTSSPSPEIPETEPLTLPQILALTDDALAQLGSYLAQVSLRSGNLSLNGQPTLKIDSLELSPRELSALLTHTPSQTTARLQTQFKQPGQWQLSAAIPQHQLNLDAELVSQADTATLAGSFSSHQNTVDLEARWTDSFIPAHAQAQANDFELDQRYAFWGAAPPLAVDLLAHWNGEIFDYRIEAFDTSDLTGASNIQLAGQGSTKDLQIQTAKVDLPWLTVESDKPILIDFTLENPLETAQLDAKLDLAKLPFIEATGQLDAQLRTRTSPQGLPILTADLQGSQITLFDSLLETASANVDLLGHEATIRSFDIRSAAGSTIRLSGGYHIQEKHFLESQLALQLENESQRLRDLFPDLEWQTASGEFHLVGPLADPQFDGQLSFASLKLPSTSTLALETAVSGKLNELQASLRATNETEALDLALALSRTPEQAEIQLSELALSELDGTPILSLAEAGTITLDPNNSSIASAGILLSGPRGQQLEISSFAVKPTEFNLHANAIDFETNVFNAWLANPIPTIRIQDFDTQATLSETQSEILTSGVASWDLKADSSVDISWLAKSDPERSNSLSIDHLDIGADSKHILLAEGHFPVSVNWSQGAAKTEIHQDAPLSFSLQSSPHPDFWASIESILPIALKRPVVKAQLSGTLNNPSGNFDFKLNSLDWRHPEDPNKNIQLQDLSASLLANADGLAIRQFQAHAGKNSVYADASLPIGETSLIDLVKNSKSLDFSPLTGKARVELLDLDALKSWLPGFLRHEGKATIEVDFDSGEITGLANIENLATRPMPPLGALSNISGQIALADGIWNVKQVKGLAEKSPFTLTGSADLNDFANPRYDLAFFSKAFPLVRDDGLLVSGDIDMKVVTDSEGSTKIAGDLILTEGLALIEPDILASSTKTVSTRPPYFAVEAKPFDEWELDVNIRGDRFLRVSNSYFQGTLSAEFSLEGNLGSPLLIGKGETNTGRIFFPASSLRISAGEAFITRDRPSELQIQATAAGRLFAHDINLDVHGTADNPELTITSNPALTQVEALLLLTTGAVPNQSGNLAQQSATSLGVFIGKGLFKKLTGGNKDSSSKLELEVGQDISLQGKKTIEASYQLSDTLQLEGEYDKRDEFNGNIKWTIFKR